MLLSFEYPEPEIEKRNNFCENTGTETELLSKCYKLRLSFPWNLNLVFFNFLESENSIKAEENRVENRKPKRFLVVIDQQDLGYILIGVMFHAMRALYKATTYTQYTPLPRDFSNNLQLCLLLRIQPTDQKIPWNSNPETQTFILNKEGEGRGLRNPTI